MTFYLIRHAQSIPIKSRPFSEWPLSPLGTRQAEQLAELLVPLGINHIFSSPFLRSLQTAKPFARKQGLQIVEVQELRERLVAPPGELPSNDVWRRSWEDFSFALEGCETSQAAQARIWSAICQIVGYDKHNCAVFTHGNVIGLFLNSLTNSAGRKEAEALMNPDVLRIEWRKGTFDWDRSFRLTGLAELATAHGQTSQENV